MIIAIIVIKKKTVTIEVSEFFWLKTSKKEITPLHSLMKTPNAIYHNATVTRERQNQLNGHKSAVIWFTGLLGFGKSTLAHSVEEALHNLDCRTFVLDGDNVRHGLSSNLTFSDDDRQSIFFG